MSDLFGLEPRTTLYVYLLIMVIANYLFQRFLFHGLPRFRQDGVPAEPVARFRAGQSFGILRAIAGGAGVGLGLLAVFGELSSPVAVMLLSMIVTVLLTVTFWLTLSHGVIPVNSGFRRCYVITRLSGRNRAIYVAAQLAAAGIGILLFHWALSNRPWPN